MKKIKAGFYAGRYNYVDFTISKSHDNKINWCWQIVNEKVHGGYKSKFEAIRAVQYYINTQKNKS